MGSMAATAARLAVASILFTGMAQAAEIKVLCSNALKEALTELVPGFERSTEHKAAVTFAGTNAIMDRMKQGDTSDVVIMADYALEELIKQGKVAPGSRVDVARSGIGVAVRAGAPRPDIGSVDGLKRALLAAKSIAYSTGPSGVYLAGLFQRLGIAEEIRPKVRQTTGEPVGAVVARGEAEIGFQQISELLPVKGIDYLGPLPAAIQHMTVFSAGLRMGAKEPDAAKAFVKFLTAPEAGAVIKKAGMEPG